MSRKTTNIIDTPDECYHLRKFKDFLFSQVSVDASGNSVNGAELRHACVTRNNNETYPVTVEELPAEVVMAIWTRLQLKNCPHLFQLALLRAVSAEIETECRDAKQCEFAIDNAKDESSAESQLQYDLVKLQKFVINNLEKFFTRLLDNSMVDNLKIYAEPGTVCEGECKCDAEKATKSNHVVGFMKNKPRKMEDRHVCLEHFSDIYQLKGSTYSFYGVFDGHSGPLAASYVACQLPYLLAKHLKGLDVTVTTDPDPYREAFECAFLKADKMFEQKRISGGTTAVCALISQQTLAHLYVAWVGDSKALLVGVHASLQLVKPHKPDAPEERKRIETSHIAGGENDGVSGTVMFVQGQWRVNGILNVSRSIGDFSVSAVIAEPDFVDIELTGVHDFLVLATDGLWDHVDESIIIDTVYNALADEEQNVEDIPKLLIELAKEADSQDNITIVIVFLKDRMEIVKHFRSK